MVPCPKREQNQGMDGFRTVKVLIFWAALLAVGVQGAGVGYQPDTGVGVAPLRDRSIVESYQSLFGETLSAEQQEGFLKLLRFIKADEEVTDIRWTAYMLATVKHETAYTWRPIREFGRGEGRRYGTPDPELGETYYGRGYVQLTWKENYLRAGRFLNKDFVRNPDKTLEPETAYKILSKGMREGWFTGRSLGDYISAGNTDYVNARRIVNGTDRAESIASEARKFEMFLRREFAERERVTLVSAADRG